MNSKISIIVPVYNSEKYIGRCLDSILWQTYAELEVIIVDDGSCDRSGEICDEYARKDDRVKVWHTENAGVSVARNYALKKVTGDYVMFVDSDDWIDSTMCEEMLLVALQKDSDMLITNAKNWQVINNELIADSSNESSESKVQQIDLETKFSFLEQYAFGVVWGILYKKSIIDGIFFDTDLIVGEDTYYFAKCIKRSKRVFYSNSLYYNYVIYENSAAHGEMTEGRMTCLKAWDRVAVLFNDNRRISESAKGAYGRQCVYYIKEIEKQSPYYLTCKQGIRKNIRYMLMTPSVKEKVDYLGYYFSPSLWGKIRIHCIRKKTRRYGCRNV